MYMCSMTHEGVLEARDNDYAANKNIHLSVMANIKTEKGNNKKVGNEIMEIEHYRRLRGGMDSEQGGK